MAEPYLKFRDITPEGNFYFVGHDKETSRAIAGMWRNEYRLVQFSLKWKGLSTKVDRVNNIVMNIYKHCPKAHVTQWTPNVLLLAYDSLNKWSPPVVVPIDFYINLREYVKAFNEKLQEEKQRTKNNPHSKAEMEEVVNKFYESLNKILNQYPDSEQYFALNRCIDQLQALLTEEK